MFSLHVVECLSLPWMLNVFVARGGMFVSALDAEYRSTPHHVSRFYTNYTAFWCILNSGVYYLLNSSVYYILHSGVYYILHSGAYCILHSGVYYILHSGVYCILNSGVYYILNTGTPEYTEFWYARIYYILLHTEHAIRYHQCSTPPTITSALHHPHLCA